MVVHKTMSFVLIFTCDDIIFIFLVIMFFNLNQNQLPYFRKMKKSMKLMK